MKQEQNTEKEREFTFTDEDFAFLAKLVNDHTGIVLPAHKRNMVYSRLARRLRALHLSTFKEYCHLLTAENNDDELGNFINAITTNLTNFFREGHHFEHLEKLLTDYTSTAKQKRLRIWSCASSSGPEPYSIAMVVAKVLERKPGWDAKILATDIDTNMLATAIHGEYSEDVMEKIPSAYHSYVTRYGASEKGMIRMTDPIRQLLTFKQLNLLHNWPMKGPFDIVFCRNVVIYFDKDTQRVLFDRIADILTPNGTLYIGHSENLFNVCNRFESKGRTIYQRIT